jgi:hypothetical protein
LIAADGTYLGRVSSNAFDRDSIVNDFGPYGSKFASTSIRNDFGKYGGQFSSLSPFNQFTSTPPKIVKGDCWAYFTVNQFLSPRIDARAAMGYLERGS